MKLPLALLFFTAACTATSTQPPPASTTAVTSHDMAEAQPATIGCEVVCEGARIEGDGIDHHAAAVADADRVVAAMHDDLLLCYRARLRTHPRAHASLTFDVVLEPDGRVRRIETTGGAMLGDATLKCMTDRLEKGAFAPVHGGGTLRIHVPITLRTTQNI